MPADTIDVTTPTATITFPAQSDWSGTGTPTETEQLRAAEVNGTWDAIKAHALDIDALKAAINGHAELIDTYHPDSGGGGGTDATTQTITLIQTQIDNGLTLSGTPSNPSATILSIDAAGGGTIPYGTEYSISGALLTFGADLKGQLLPGDVATIIWS